ncbi:ABC transporter ATP-binding protein [Baekduia sp. Peel2402]|uniref:ABC transporter ATP-binding protein n=1 Tax=Baekduia sp. Peel2402 TaxID=3458296 RepID=UPI00403EA4DD
MSARPPRPAAPSLVGVDLGRRFEDGESHVQALAGVDLVAAPGELLAIVGPSGSGKSTLLHLLGGLDRPDTGRVLLEGQEISRLSGRRLALVRRRRIGFLLQFYGLLPGLTAVENVAFPLLLDGVRDAQARALAALASVGLEHRGAHRPSELSGGEQQRVGLARAVVTRPAIVLADEPTGSLDSATSRVIFDLLRATAAAATSVVVVSHDPLVERYADRLVRLEDGVVCAAASPPPSVTSTPAVTVG